MLSADEIADALAIDEGSGKLTVVPRPDDAALRKRAATSIDLRLGRWFRSFKQTRSQAYSLVGPEPDEADKPSEVSRTKQHFVPFGEKFVLASMLSPLYIAEISPPALRGRLVSLNQMAIVLGIVGVYFVNWGIARQGDDAWVQSTGWRLMLGSAAIPALIFLLLLLRAPDTPRWLVMKGRHDHAQAVLRRVNGNADADGVLAEIRDSLMERTGGMFSFGAACVLVGLALSVLQQFVGINAVLYYAPEIFKSMGASSDSALLQTVLVGAVNMAFTLVAIVTVDRFGRKPLLVIGGAVMAAAMIALGTMFSLGELGVGALVAILVYIAGFAMSWGPVVWVLLSEMFPNAIKGKVLAAAVAAQWLANLLVSWSFKMLDGNSVLNAHFHHGFAYWLYGAMSLLAIVFVVRFVPETKGRTLESVGEFWRSPAGTNSPAGAP